MARALLVVLDDCGIDQLACYGSENHYLEPHAYANTPNIDALAASGVRFNQARAAPLCSPTRASLLTGRYPFRHGAGGIVKLENASSSFLELGNPTTEVGFPALLAGHKSAIGKWHMGLVAPEGGTMPDHPLSLGFDSWRGTLGNLTNYTPFKWWENGVQSLISGTHPTIHTRKQASRWINGRAEPWFMWLAFNACHSPYNLTAVPPPAEHGFGSVASNTWANTIFRTNLECLDRQLGILLGQLTPDTIVFVLGDNGSTHLILQPSADEPRYPVGHPLHQAGDETAQLSVAPYDKTKFKGTVYEGGIHVPLIVSVPGVDAHECSDLVDAVDIFATIAELLGVSVPAGVAQDSISFADCLTGGTGNRDFSFSEQFTLNGTTASERTVEDRCYIREDGPERWKLVRRLGLSDEFYELDSDPLETTNLGTAHVEYQPTADDLSALLSS